MARQKRSEGQLAFDIDGMLHEADVAAAPPWQGAPLHFTTDFYQPRELDAAFRHWQFLYGRLGSIPKSHMWNRAIGRDSGTRFGEHSLELYRADLRCWEAHPDQRSGCSCVGELVEQGICEPCG